MRIRLFARFLILQLCLMKTITYTISFVMIPTRNVDLIYIRCQVT